ncbi:MAG: hypothetical protein A3D87_03575 [Omnitrophica WOR_2 bacterium RIFCSPHIGHO2_02_FULL_50_17]|nr:MAG: hypothetical protein A3D87_03575 [Omnitrophica WOR_2 bacterium RIFCSPHIGHO2_02_FULL_50_17]
MEQKEFELINIIGSEKGANQRDFSNLMNLSLGMINLLLKRLVSKGHVHIQQLGKRKFVYVLTPEGLAEREKKFKKHMLKTIDAIGLIKDQIARIIEELYFDGERTFYILGKSDLVYLVEIVLKEGNFENCRILCANQVPAEYIDGVALICVGHIEYDRVAAKNKINLVEELARCESHKKPQCRNENRDREYQYGKI